MAAYLFAHIEVIDSVAYEEYRRLVPAVIEAHGGRYLSGGAEIEVLEWSHPSGRLVIVEFPNMARLKDFYESDSYRPLTAIRRRSTHSTLLAVNGV